MLAMNVTAQNKLHKEKMPFAGVFFLCNLAMALRCLPDKEQFAVLWQRPHLVIYHQLKFVDVVAYFVE